MSGPIVDRIDIWLEVDRVLPSDLSGESSGEKSGSFRTKVAQARNAQQDRFKGRVSRNSEMSARDLVEFIHMDKEVERTLNLAAERLGLSPRVYHRMIKVARTIADLEGSDDIKTEHILEAIEYRPKKFEV